jgi:hypothetical protein
MQLQFGAYELEHYTLVEVGYEGGESVNALFFTDAETAEEEKHQKVWKLMQKLMHLCFENDDCSAECDSCSLVRAYIISFVAIGIALFVYSPAALLLSGILFVPLSVLTTNWNAGKAQRALRAEQIRFLRPVQKKLYEFAEQNDFRSALMYSLHITGLGLGKQS